MRSQKPPSQNWRTFLENHVKTMVSADFFTVPTIRFQVLYVFLVLAHDQRRIVHFNVTALQPPSGARSSSGRPFLLSRSLVTCFGTATGSSAVSFGKM